MLQKVHLKLKAACAPPITRETPLALFSKAKTMGGNVGVPTSKQSQAKGEAAARSDVSRLSKKLATARHSTQPNWPNLDLNAH